MGLVSIIIINYNGNKFNKDCIDSLLQQDYQNFEIIFVDNASSDGSLEEVKKIYIKQIKDKKIIIIESKKNLGFSGGNDLGVKFSNKKTSYICLLNNDTIVEKNRLKELVYCMEGNKKLGMVGSLVLDKGKEEELIGLYKNRKQWGINNYIFESSFRDLTEQEIKSGVLQTTGIGGCALIYKKELAEIPFPDFYFAYAEDTYLSMSIILQGYELAICTKSIVHHFGSGSFGKKTSLNKAFHGSKNNLCNILIFHKLSNIIKLFPVFLIFELAKIVMGGSPLTRLSGLVKAIYRCLTHRKEIKKEKNKIKKIQRITDEIFIKKLSKTIFTQPYWAKQQNSWFINSINTCLKGYFRCVRIK